jgi:hypothetical protein
VHKEKARLQERKERHARQRKAAYRRMVNGAAEQPDQDTAGGGGNTADGTAPGAGGEAEAASAGKQSGRSRVLQVVFSASLVAACIAAGVAAYLRSAPQGADGALA